MTYKRLRVDYNLPRQLYQIVVHQLMKLTLLLMGLVVMVVCQPRNLLLLWEVVLELVLPWDQLIMLHSVKKQTEMELVPVLVLSHSRGVTNQTMNLICRYYGNLEKVCIKVHKYYNMFFIYR